MNIRLKPEDVHFASKLNVDTNGVVFYWDGGVYRAISPVLAPIYQKMLQSDLAQRLFDIGLVETEITPIVFEGYGLVLKHRKVPFTSYVTEWCGSMLKDAALLTLDLSLALADVGLELQDAHPWNILFDGSKPRFVDFSSILPVKDIDHWLPSREFIGMFFQPLQLMSFGCASQARSLLIDPKNRRGKRVTNNEVLITLAREREVRAFLDTMFQPAPSIRMGRKETILHLRNRIAAISIPLEKTKWSDYCSEEVDFSTRDTWIVKRKSAFDAISLCRPKTLLDIGSNTGWFSKLAAKQGSSVVAADKDETCVNKLYLNDEARKLDILPLAMDFRNPTPAYGIGLRCAPATERLSCEMVLGLAIVHHLVFKQYLRFDVIIKNLAAFTKRWLLVEFIPSDDKYVSEWYDERFSWYTVDEFVKELRKHFRKIESFPSNPAPRLMFLCER